MYKANRTANNSALLDEIHDVSISNEKIVGKIVEVSTQAIPAFDDKNECLTNPSV